MRVGIISDTHGGLKAWEEAIKGPFEGVELILHAGDLLYHGPRNPFPKDYDPQTLAWAINHAPVPLLIAKGNCDADVDQLMINFPLQSPYVYCFIDGLSVMMLHGEEQDVEDLLELGGRYQVNLLITGHTQDGNAGQLRQTQNGSVRSRGRTDIRQHIKRYVHQLAQLGIPGLFMDIE